MSPSSKWESRIVGVGIGIAGPVLTFVFMWWAAAAVHLHVLQLPEGVIIASALTGLGIGLLLDVVFLRQWVKCFYTADARWVAAVYLALFVVAFGLFMGTPFGTLLVGIAAGAYVGRRAWHDGKDQADSRCLVHRVALLAALLTAGAALPIGIAALQSERPLLDGLADLLHVKRSTFQGGGGLMLIGVLCALLFVTQYVSARIAGQLAFTFGARRTEPTVSRWNRTPHEHVEAPTS